MKRPLCFCCLIFLLLLRLVLGLAGAPENPYDKSPARICLRGSVGRKEFKNGKTVVYLEDIETAEGPETRCPSDHVSPPEAGTSDIGLICVFEDGPVPPIGARIEVCGKLRLYEAATNPGEFDLRLYYLYKGYGGRVNAERWQDAGGGRYDAWREGLWRLRCRLGEVYDRILPPADSGVMRAVVLGDKGELSGELKELYRINGIVHILAISGLHISILGMGLYRLLRRMTLPIAAAAGISVFFMVNYAVFVGAGTSTVRAVMMFIILACAETERRSYDLPTALLLSAAVTAVFNPYELLMSAFWLSYLAVFGIAVFYPALTEGLRLSSGKLSKLFSAFLASLATSLFTLPVILCCYYEAPLYASFLNLLVIPLMSALMIFGLAGLVLGCLHPAAGIVAAFPCHLILSLYTILCERIMTLPMHSLIAGCPGTFRLIVSYLLMLAVLPLSARTLRRLQQGSHPALRILQGCLSGPLCRFKSEKDRLRRLLLLRSALCLLALLLLLMRFHTGLTVTMLDVGQGDGLCLETADCVVMIDGGSTSRTELARYRLCPFLKYCGIDRVDYWYVTHPDTDHDSGLLELLSDDTQTIRIGAVVLPDACGAAEDFSKLTDLCAARNVPVLWNSAGKKLTLGALSIECLHPAAGYRTDDVNSYSQVLAVNGFGFRGLFTGDATTESEEAILRNGFAGSYPFLKLGHHGSSTSSSEEFLDLVSPDFALISCGYQNRYGHPHEEVMQRLDAMGCAVCRTDLDGAVIITCRNGNIRVSRFRPRPSP